MLSLSTVPPLITTYSVSTQCRTTISDFCQRPKVNGFSLCNRHVCVEKQNLFLNLVAMLGSYCAVRLSLICVGLLFAATGGGHMGFCRKIGMPPHRRCGGFDLVGGGGDAQVEAAADHVLGGQQRGARGKHNHGTIIYSSIYLFVFHPSL